MKDGIVEYGTESALKYWWDRSGWRVTSYYFQSKCQESLRYPDTSQMSYSYQEHEVKVIDVVVEISPHTKSLRLGNSRN